MLSWRKRPDALEIAKLCSWIGHANPENRKFSAPTCAI